MSLAFIRERSRMSNHGPALPFLKEPSPSLFPSREELAKVLVVILIASLVALACKYIAMAFNPFSRPYCDNNRSSAISLSDSCKPCPDNGVCIGGILKCSDGYIRQGNLCVEDSNLNQLTQTIFEWVKDHTCKGYASVLCHQTGTIWVQQANLVAKINDGKLFHSHNLKSDILMLARRRAMEIAERTLEKRINPEGIIELKCPDRLAESYKSSICCICQWLHKHFWFMSSAIFLLVSLLQVFWQFRKKHHIERRAEHLYEQVCDILEEQSRMKTTSSSGIEPWIVASQLRDHLLSPKERKGGVLWSKVEELLQEDSRVGQYPKLVKGEQKTVWQWQVESSLSARIRTKSERAR